MAGTFKVVGVKPSGGTATWHGFETEEAAGTFAESKVQDGTIVTYEIRSEPHHEPNTDPDEN